MPYIDNVRLSENSQAARLLSSHLIWLVPTATTGRAGTPSEAPCTDAAQGRLSREGRASLCSVPRTYGRGLLDAMGFSSNAGLDRGAEGYINM